MTIFECLKTKNIDELTEWFDKHMMFDNASWWHWWDENYCKKCEPIIATDNDGDKHEFAYCELNGNCKFFSDMDKIPDNKQIIKMWLESEYN